VRCLTGDVSVAVCVSEKETRQWRADLSYLQAAPGVTTAKPFWLRGTLLALQAPWGNP